VFNYFIGLQHKLFKLFCFTFAYGIKFHAGGVSRYKQFQDCLEILLRFGLYEIREYVFEFFHDLML